MNRDEDISDISFYIFSAYTMKKIKLFCFPYAGGSSLVYRNWKNFLSPTIEIIPFELAGRGRRIADQCYHSLEEAVQDIYSQIQLQIKDSDYAFFGHSMGGLIAVELARKIEQNGLHPARHLFVSGRSAPGTKPKYDYKFHLLSDDAFKEELVKLGGTPKELFDHPELIQYFLPILKSDFALSESNDNVIQDFVLKSDLTVLFGNEDSLVVEDHNTWHHYTSKSCDICYFDGDHFFINDKMEEVVNLINKTLVREA